MFPGASLITVEKQEPLARPSADKRIDTVWPVRMPGTDFSTAKDEGEE